MRKDFKPFCAKFQPVDLKSLSKTFLSYENCSFRERNVPFAKGTFLSVYGHTGLYHTNGSEGSQIKITICNCIQQTEYSGLLFIIGGLPRNSVTVWLGLSYFGTRTYFVYAFPISRITTFLSPVFKPSYKGIFGW